ncbi:glycosyltransferase family 2 protein [Vibrio breoganii]|uniref:glycosyltransferase family 2 protein n=1 Tax=Vibrio breoganii TaxID=553239 RepID=UPI000C85E290|nr:glycosyltransferase family A protein [Vibrio breoganii]
MRLIIISAVYNMSQQIVENIEMLKSQTYFYFEAYFGDDLSTDDSVNVIKHNIKDDARFKLLEHDSKKFSLGNIYSLIELAQPKDEDIIVLLDGDDCLADENTLSYLTDFYSNNDCLMTFGSFRGINFSRDNICSDYPWWSVKFNLFRYCNWRASHLKTFKYVLWRNIEPSYLTISRKEYSRNIRGFLVRGRIRTWLKMKSVKYEDIVTEDEVFVRRCDDKFFTLPMLEMSREKAFYIHRIMYKYNGCTSDPNFGDSSKKWSQRLLRYSAFRKPKHRPLL